MKRKSGKPHVWRGLTAVSAFLLSFVMFGYGCAQSYASQVNSFLGVQTSRVVNNDEGEDEIFMPYKSSYGDFTQENLDKLEEDVYAHIVKEVEEGAVLLKNNGVLPLEEKGKVSIFGFAGYDSLYHTPSAGSRTYLNAEKTTDLKEALEGEGFEVNETLLNAYDAMVSRATVGGGGPGPAGGGRTAFTIIWVREIARLR